MASTKKTLKTIPSLSYRITLGKLAGAGIGLAVFFSLPTVQPDIDVAVRFGMLGWYILFGAMIAFAGLYTKCPYVKWPFPAMLRGALLGFGFNLVLGALVHQDMMQAFSDYSEFHFANSMPILQLALEGLIWGALMDLFLTRMAGEGKDLVKNL